MPQAKSGLWLAGAAISTKKLKRNVAPLLCNVVVHDLGEDSEESCIALFGLTQKMISSSDVIGCAGNL